MNYLRQARIALVLTIAGSCAKRDLVELIAPILGCTRGGNIAV